MNLKFFALAFAFCSQSLAGGWVSSGGEVFKDAHNPWFVKNTIDVSYCVNIAAGSISVSDADVRATVRASLDHWVKELQRASNMNEDGHAALGQQTFREVPCPTIMSDPDSPEANQWPALRFLFGYETLSAKELKFLEETRKYIGVSVRTSYDRVKLAGRGFIFIASDTGANTYENTGNLVDRAWSRPNLLKYALLHEIGHVFGLPHTGSGLMSEAFLEQMLNKTLVSSFEKLPIPSFFEPEDQMEICDWLPGAARTFFKLPATDQCLVLQQKSTTKWEISSKKDKSSIVLTKLGEIISSMPDLLDFQPKPTVFIQLTSEQKVYSAKETVFRSFMFGPMLKEFGAKGNFVSVAPIEVKPIYVRVTPSSLLLTGTFNNKVELVFSYTSPLGLLLTQSPKP